jgi:putative oxidoreductase
VLRASGQLGQRWNAALWLLQLLLAFAFGHGGFLRITKPIAELGRMMGWPAALPPMLVRLIGGAELVAAAGLLLPAATRVLPVLTVAAAAGLAVVMAMAAVFHLVRGEGYMLPVNLTLGALAALIAWGRVRRAPIAPR